MKRLSCLCGLWFVVACGSSATSSDGSGIAIERDLATLSADEQAQMCDYLDDRIGPPRTIACDFDGSVEIEARTSCAFERVPASCAATVSDAERCVEALASDVCRVYFPECAAMFECVWLGEGKPESE